MNDNCGFSDNANADSFSSSLNESSSDMTLSDHIEAYFSSEVSVKQYALDHGLNYDSFKFRLYRDPRYIKKTRKTKPESMKPKIIEAKLAGGSDGMAIKVNGFDISISDERSMKCFLKQIKSL